MAKRAVDNQDPRTVVAFRCAGCKHVWKETPPKILEAPERESHPWRYLADCPECGRADCEQAPWERAMLSAYGRHTGPTSEAGKRRSSFNRTLSPHTPEELARTRFNRLQHGLYAKVQVFFPAKPGKYPHCNGCRWLDNGCGEWEHGACLVQTELFMRHRIAYQTRNAGLLTELAAERQAHTQALISNLLIAIAQGGVELRRPHYVSDKDGNVKLVEYVDANGDVRRVEDVLAHPLIKPLYELLAKNSEILAREGMTEKSQEDDEQLRGFICRDEQQQVALADHAHQQSAKLEKLLDLVERSRERQQRDPVLIEHQREEG
jgi:hypothetical protein